MRFRVTFETDVVSDYFDRDVNRGSSIVKEQRQSGVTRIADVVGPKLQNGIATLSVRLPEDAQVGEVIEYTCEVNDPTLTEPFCNSFKVKVKEAVEKPTNGHGGRRKPPSDEKGDSREVPLGIKLPNITDVYEKDWTNHSFDKYSALKVTISSNEVDGRQQDVHDFYVNLDNLYYRTEVKADPKSSDILRARFRLALVLIGLALLHDDATSEKATTENVEGAEEGGVEKKIYSYTKAVAPVILPMITALAELEAEEESNNSGAGLDT